MTKLLFKRIDFWLQLFLVLSLLVNFFGIFYFRESLLIQFLCLMSFFIIAIVQIISFWINFNFSLKSIQRTSYKNVVFYLIILLLISVIVNSFWQMIIYYYVFFMLFFSPILAIWYLVITWFELREMEKLVLEKNNWKTEK